MKVQVKFFAGLRELLPAGEFPYPLDVPDGAFVEAVLNTLGVPEDKPKIVLVNGRHATPGQVLCEGDVLSAFPPVAGG